MPKSRPPYPPEFRQRMVELVRAGRTPEELAEEFEPSAQAIRNWVKQAELDQGVRKDGLTTEDRAELQRLAGRTSNSSSSMRSQKEPRPGLLGRADQFPIGIRVREGEPSHLSGPTDVPRSGPLSERLLRMGGPSAFGPSTEQ